MKFKKAPKSPVPNAEDKKKPVKLPERGGRTAKSDAKRKKH